MKHCTPKENIAMETGGRWWWKSLKGAVSDE